MTIHEQLVEEFFTPTNFKFIEPFHGPKRKPLVKNDDGDRIHPFFPTSHDDLSPAYAIDFDEYIPSTVYNEIASWKDDNLLRDFFRPAELEYESLEETKRLINNARLLYQHNTENVFLFFF